MITSPRHAESIVNGIKFLDLASNYTSNILITETLDILEVDFALKKSILNLSFAAPWIFRKRHIEKCGSIINVHLTELPKFGGGAEASWQLMSNYRRSALTIHLVDEGIDTGNILLQETIKWPNHLHKPQEIKQHNEDFSIPIIESFLEDKLSGKFFSSRPQNIEEQLYFPRLNTSIHGYVNWNWSGEHIYRFIQAFDDPYPGAISRINSRDNLYHLKNPMIENLTIQTHPFMNGLIVRVQNERYYIICSNTLLSVSLFAGNTLEQVKPKLGDRMTNHAADLEKALNTRVIYKP